MEEETEEKRDRGDKGDGSMEDGLRKMEKRRNGRMEDI